MRKDLFEDLYILETQHWWHISKRNIIIHLIKQHLSKKNAKLLDMGCGTGKNLEEFKKYGQVYGLDSSKEAINFCKKRGLENIKLGHAEKTPFKSNFFDLITLLDVLEHTDDNTTLREIYRLLKKNGLLILTVPAFAWLWSEWDEILDHRRRYKKEELIILLKKHGFTVSYSSYLYSFLMLPALIIRKIKKRIFQKEEYPSDFKLSNHIINKIFHLISKIEFMIARRIPIPFGTSIIVVVKK